MRARALRAPAARRYSSIVTAVGRREVRQAALAELDRRGCSGARSRPSSRARAGMSANSCAISAWRLEVLLGREAPRPALVAEDVALRRCRRALRARGSRSASRNCTGCVATTGRPSRAASATERATQRLGVRLAGALHLEVVAAGKELRPALRASRSRGLAVVGERAPARRRRAAAPGQRDQASVRLLQPLARDLGAPAVLVAQPGAREQVAQAQIARRATRTAASRR